MSEYRHIANLKGDKGDQGERGIGSHGVISEPTDLDQLRGSDDMGTYTARGENLLNGPPIEDDRLATLEIISNASNGVTQRVTTAYESWWRQANGATSFALWSRSVISDSVGRIIASKNAEHPMEDGDLLVLIDTPSYFTDFTGQEPGEFPQGWTQRWVPGEHTIEYDHAASNGLVLTQPGYSGSLQRRALSWDLLDGVLSEGVTTEIAFKWRGAYDTQPRTVTYGSGTAGSENGFWGGVLSTTQTSTMGSFNNGSAATFSGDEGIVDHEPGEWWATRFRVEPGNRIYVRSWKWDTPEPTEWDRTTGAGSAMNPGWTGLMSFGRGWTQYDWIGVSFDGGRAPTGG